MDWHDVDGDPPSRQYEVGYKKPPAGTRFSKDRQPPRRKKKLGDLSFKDLLWKLLQEPRRVLIDGKPVWRTNAHLVSQRAFQEAEKGSSTLMRLCNELLLGPGGPDEEVPPEIILGGPISQLP
jgi:hypothetical protein